MSDVTDTRDRVIRLESETAHLTRTVSGMSVKVDEMHQLLQQGRGARWMLYLMVGSGGFVAGFIGKLAALASMISK